MAKRRTAQGGSNGAIRIEYFPLDTIAGWPRNPKLHADAEIDESFERFGFVAPAIRDERTQRLVAGHGRLERLIAWRDMGKPAPKRIEVRDDDGAWLMPVVCGVAFDNEQEAEAYLLADNQITMLRGWDGPKLQAIGDDLINGAGLLGTGFDEESIRAEMEARVEGANGSMPDGDNVGPNPGLFGSPADANIPESKYKEQYGVIVVCADSADQERVYNALKDQGYNCKVVVT
jgi:hypothetical protein